MTTGIEFLRALVLLSSLAVLLLTLVLIAGLTIDESPATESTFACGTLSNVDKNGQPFTAAQLNGKALFKQNCATCHNRNMIDNMTGPALAGVRERWADFAEADLYKWIRNSKAMVDAKHPRALKIWKEWDRNMMTPFPNFSDEQISDILAYVEGVGQY